MNRSDRADPLLPMDPMAAPAYGNTAMAEGASMPAAARVAVSVMRRLSVGTLVVRFPDGTTHRFGHGAPQAEMALANWNLCRAALKSGDIGFGETYIAGDWTTPDLGALMDVMVANRAAIEAVIYGTWWGRALYRLKHLLNRNSRAGSRRNIHAHYDIGNAFYALWLDSTMTYSSALFDDGKAAADADPAVDFAALPAAQDAKFDRVLDHLALAPGARLLEIGCGWGGLAERAARRGLDVTGITLSPSQLVYARGRLADAGLAAKARFELRDYRDRADRAGDGGKYDGIASIEMFEAVGERYWDGYFASLRDRLKPGGRAVVQTITIDEALFDDYRTGSDFIQQYIFPGGMLPSRVAFRERARHAGLAIVDEHPFGGDYARTLRAWLHAFDAGERKVRAIGFDTPFVRTWRFYLAYCASAFRHRNTDVVQFVLAHA